MQFTYRTKGVCSSNIIIDIENDILQDVRYVGGCHGNLQAIGRLVKGMTVDEVIGRLSGIRCGYKDTSCPDQLAKALTEYKAAKGD